jgi:hypothetical protein
MRGFKRKIETGDAQPGSGSGALAQHLEKESAAASDVEHQTFFLRFVHGAFDEAEMIAQDEAAIGLLQAAGRGGFRNEPIIGRIVGVQFRGRGERMQADEAAVAALDDLKNFVGGAIEAVGCGE